MEKVVFSGIGWYFVGEGGILWEMMVFSRRGWYFPGDGCILQEKVVLSKRGWSFLEDFFLSDDGDLILKDYRL